MRILKIRLKNIHSLKGKQEVDFTAPPLSNAGLFAITGPTGSGKSTLLDVITLALFNQIPRFDKKISLSEIEKLGSVITHHTDDAYAEIEYMSNGQTYRSTWSISKNRNGKLKDYEMTLATLPDETYLDLKKSDVPDENEKIIGLNYDQFIRSILLSQGEFAKFLKSDEKDRAKLLEDITGTQIYREIGKRAFEKAKEIKEQFAILKAEINSIMVLDKEDIENKNQELTTIKATIDKSQIHLKSKQNEYQILVRIVDLQEKLKKTANDKAELVTQKEAFEPSSRKLSKHQHLNPFREDLSILKEEKKQILLLETQIEIFQQKLTESKTQLEEILVQAAGFLKKDVIAENLITSLNNFEQIISGLNSELSGLIEKGKNIRTRLNIVLNASEFDSAIKIKNLPTTDEQIIEVNNLLHILSNQPGVLSEDGNLELNLKLKNTELSLERIGKNLNYIVQIFDIKGELEKLKADHHTYSNQIKIHTDSLRNPQNEKDVLKNEFDQLQIEKESQLKIAGLEEQRANLTEDEPCPLCGSTNHPYRLHGVFSNLGHLILQIEKKDIEIKKLEKTIHEIQTSIHVLEGKSLTLIQQIENKEKSLQSILTAVESEYISLDVAQMRQLLDTQKTEQHNLKNLISARLELKFLQEISALISELDTVVQEYKVKEKALKTTYDGADIKKDTDQLRKKYEDVQKMNYEAGTHLQYATKEQEKYKKSYLNKYTDLKSSLEKLGYVQPEEAYQDVLPDALYRELSGIQTNMQNAVALLEANEQQCLSDLKNLNFSKENAQIPEKLLSEIKLMETERDNLNLSCGALERELKINDRQQKILDAKISNLAEIETKALKWLLLAEYIGDATGNRYAKFAQQLSLNYLIQLANQRLTKLSDRYLLSINPTESADLRISDLYQGGTIRSVKTLSGGESFLVSLALALSLSDMASKNVKLESLFIDEGFGTLDAETLEISISTLERLQSESERTIGIISHVDTLKERIYTQVQIEKDNLGYSTIKISG